MRKTSSILFCAVALTTLFLANAATAEDSMGFTREQIHEKVVLHEKAPLSEESLENSGILLAHFEPVDYFICGYVLGPLSESNNPAHEAIMLQIIFASGDWVEENPDRAKDIDTYTLAGLESGLRAYEVVLKSDSEARHPLLDELANTGAIEFNRQYPCREQ